MKTKWCLIAVVALSLLMPRRVEATGTCTAARFHDWQDMGCNQNYAGTGGAPSSKSNPGGNQSSCNEDCGMPRWSVSEPYINLHISDTPLSYKTSSGKEINFQFFYRERPQVPLSDESPITSRTSVYDQIYPFGSTCGPNAFWSHNWNMSVLV